MEISAKKCSFFVHRTQKQCVLACMEQLDIYETQESKWKDWFCTQNKKDDLADCYIQGLTLRN